MTTDDPAAITRAAIALYLELHRKPELSGAEVTTAERLTSWLRADGYQVATGVGGHGVVGLLSRGVRSTADGPVVMIRAELDALPIQERTGLSYASRAAGVMHACGHDLHVAAVAGAARTLAATKGWRGTVMVVGQPAEETLRGARAMLDDGLYERFRRPTVLLAQHTAPMPAGMVAHGRGPVLAGSVSLEVVIHGRGGHASAPHLTVDPVVIAAAVVLRLQTIVSRECSPAEQVVLSVSSLHAGSSDNVLPDRAELGITIRALTQESLDRVVAAVRRIIRGECAAGGCTADPELRVTSRSPVTVPDPAATELVRRAHDAEFGAHRVTVWPGSMSSEDFPILADDGAGPGIPLVYWMLGCVGKREWVRGSSPANHSAAFAPDVGRSLPTGIAALVVGALAHLNPLGSIADPFVSCHPFATPE